MNKIQFISPEPYHCYIQGLAKYLDIEFVRDRNAPRKSDKALIMWNPYAYLIGANHQWKKDLYDYFRENNKPVYIVERAALPESIYIDKNGYLALSSSYYEENWNKPLNEEAWQKTVEFIENFTFSEDSLEKQNNRIIEPQFLKELNIDKNKIKVFVPMQVAHDTVIILWSDWVKSVVNFQNIIRELADKNDDIIFLVKNHPVDKKNIMLPSKNIKIVDNYHYKDCIQYSDKVLTINSGVGFQAMMWQKPVITVGGSYYQFKGINYKANSEGDILDLIHRAEKPNMEKVRRFIHFLKYNFYTHCIMQKLEGNSSRPEKIKRIVFEHPTKKEIIIKGGLSYE